ncbi:MAG: helix-turn-helix transcriptional regulator [Proteobacteria bacterium]|nr:helix-turn-helix transcriptional regulator [Pseudomonadota bacterium]
MDSDEFVGFRKKLNKTQSQMAQLLGVSVKAIHSYEQGWRSVPAHVEKQMLFLVARVMQNGNSNKPCWEIKNCPDERKKTCPVFEFDAGKLCWMISGTLCEGHARKSWQEKMKICRQCKALIPVLKK